LYCQCCRRSTGAPAWGQGRGSRYSRGQGCITGGYAYHHNTIYQSTTLPLLQALYLQSSHTRISSGLCWQVNASSHNALEEAQNAAALVAREATLRDLVVIIPVHVEMK